MSCIKSWTAPHQKTSTFSFATIKSRNREIYTLNPKQKWWHWQHGPRPRAEKNEGDLFRKVGYKNNHCWLIFIQSLTIFLAKVCFCFSDCLSRMYKVWCHMRWDCILCLLSTSMHLQWIFFSLVHRIYLGSGRGICNGGFFWHGRFYWFWNGGSNSILLVTDSWIGIDFTYLCITLKDTIDPILAWPSIWLFFCVIIQPSTPICTKFHLRSVAPEETQDHEQPEDQESRWRCKYLMLRGVMSDSSG